MRILRLIEADPGVTLSGVWFRGYSEPNPSLVSKADGHAWGPYPVLFWALVAQADGVTAYPVTSLTLTNSARPGHTLVELLKAWATPGWHQDPEVGYWSYAVLELTRA